MTSEHTDGNGGVYLAIIGTVIIEAALIVVACLAYEWMTR